MIDNPLMDNPEEPENKNTDETPNDTESSYDYTDNLTAKLGGNYAKIIEFYDSRL